MCCYQMVIHLSDNDLTGVRRYKPVRVIGNEMRMLLDTRMLIEWGYHIQRGSYGCEGSKRMLMLRYSVLLEDYRLRYTLS